ncbi:MAG: hypothetical protein AABX70_04485 [Nanoarchaeota archaeon]
MSDFDEKGELFDPDEHCIEGSVIGKALKNSLQFSNVIYDKEKAR